MFDSLIEQFALGAFLIVYIVLVYGLYARWQLKRILETEPSPPPIPPTFQSCVRCGAVSIPHDDRCPECYLRLFALGSRAPDMFTESDIHDVIHRD